MSELRYGDDPREVTIDALAALRASCGFFPRSRDEIRAQLEGSRWIAAAFAGDALVGFARAISDGITNAYVSSVMVDAAVRRRGVGRELMRRLMDGRPPAMRWVLHARADAIDFYRAIGFAPATDMYWAGRRAGA